ncbi:toxin-activating lysine-acyltransferase [Klebsiella michiganensis]|uniref:toxin-activating lysine-acyltransferase n=1 Tax=Klebsiella michiganensis TaxID=1134687 RepID=UPI00292D9CA0|nr:toxin-activating lysine-acyltransferase [Klebsiella michiganensis]HCQ8416778.1 toxin-activating lysine-acyltransferase [Klebsiella michiganensis]
MRIHENVNLNYYEQIGVMVDLLNSITVNEGISKTYLSRVLIPAVRTQNVCIINNINDEPVAFFIWGYFTQTVHNLLLSGSDYCFDIYDLNEGDNLWILDCKYSKTFPLAILKFVSEKFTKKRINFRIASMNYSLFDYKFHKEKS